VFEHFLGIFLVLSCSVTYGKSNQKEPFYGWWYFRNTRYVIILQIFLIYPDPIVIYRYALLYVAMRSF
jgi:hypothetical protein